MAIISIRIAGKHDTQKEQRNKHAAPPYLVTVLLIAKQTNYMLIFFAPLAILGGIFLSRISAWAAVPLLSAQIVGGILLTGLEQLPLQASVVNSRSIVDFAKDNPDTRVFSDSNAIVMSHVLASLDDDASGVSVKLESFASASCHDQLKTAIVEYLIIDNHAPTGNVESKEAEQVMSRLQFCLEKHGDLVPAKFGLGYDVGVILTHITKPIPIVGDRFALQLASYTDVEVATVYRIGSN